MKKMRRIYAAALAAVLMMAMLAGCAKDDTDVTPEAPSTVAPAVTEAEAETEVETKTEAPAATEPDVEDETESGTPAPTENVDSTDEVGTEEYPPIVQWFLDNKFYDPEYRARWEKRWAAATPEEREGMIESVEKEWGYQYDIYVTGEYPAIFQWYLDHVCMANYRAMEEDEWANATLEERENKVESIMSVYGDEYDAYLNGDKDDTPAEPETETEPESKPEAPEFGSIEAIATLGGKQATVQNDKDECLVYIFDETKNHGNPYDVTWDYGKDYDSYVETADWSLVFDAEYYKATFPMLAQLYHNDDALLLKHFQTVGIHEGRQASENFNIAAYMDNCDKALRDAFGDNYECYYLYYLLHQETESGVKTTGSYKKQLAQELTAIQEREFKAVNKYRREVGSQEVKFDSELAAFANYRAYMDCTEGWDEHDGMLNLQDNHKMRDVFFNPIGADIYCENKYTIAGYAGREHTGDQGMAYRNSKSHYETMIDTDFNYVGCGNYYVSDQDYNWGGQYDTNVITLDSYADTVNTAYNSK